MPQDFSHQNLRGRSFKGQDLAEANFSYADIRSCDFRKTNLRQTKFIGAKAGVQKRWRIVQLIAALVLLVMSGLTCIFAGILVSFGYGSLYYLSSDFSIIAVIITFTMLLLTQITIIRQGFTALTFSTIAIVIAIAVGVGLVTDIIGLILSTVKG
ncbi:pentapeptide repeat-containing protein [Nostoc sphaeroides CHAB 2801]|uniref:pentapeptide repeat-containing protein n=1 Tax=Nostoc sphaeroides TaxID=446679 RepID=UPI001E62C1EC|nr:pentapeptide repeat-containing protein [Nostoc sphaeroides]MCC5632521.1 pentapeptide repeat-containing protein [Nostoc sphaeroides CHAB 2801]